MKYLFVLMFGALVVACTVPVKQSDIDAANYPVMPTQQEADDQIRTYLSTVLKDPDSLKLECQSIQKGWARQFRDRAAEFGWVIPCTVNAKNSYGGYTGAKSYIFLFSTSGLKALKTGTFRNFKEHVGYIE